MGETRRLGDVQDWEQAEATRLWRFHLHYFQWAWSFVQHPDRAWASAAFLWLWRSWRSCAPFGARDAWAPYVAAVRAWTLCGVYRPLVEGTSQAEAFVEDLATHAGYLRWHLEHDVGGNHLIKNLKAVFGLGLFLGREGFVKTARRQLRRELDRQILEDGGHFERSPSYHCEVLGDLIDLTRLSHAAGVKPLAGMATAIADMRRWLGSMLMPDGDVPVFNDGVPVGSDRIALLQPARSAASRLVHLGASGYVVLRPDEATHLVLDVGPPCPSELPAHAHACCLSFELAIDGMRVLVNSGTSTYEPGPRRSHERSTRAHNTLEVDGSDQTEVWGTFRAARRARPCLHLIRDDGTALEVVASHDGYRRLPGKVIHRRRLRVCSGRVDIVDEVCAKGASAHIARAFLHAAPGVPVAKIGEGFATVGPMDVRTPAGHGVSMTPWAPGTDAVGWVAEGFGRLAPAAGIELCVRGTSRLRLATTLSWRAPRAE